MAVSDRIVLGSGELYLVAETSTVPAPDAMCIAANLFSYVKGGATLEYKPTKYTAKDDLGYVMKEALTDEEVILKVGVMTFNGDTLNKLVDTGAVTTAPVSTPTMRTLKIGGIGNASNTKYVICFKHADAEDGDVYVQIVGSNQAGLSITFAKDKETVVDTEFKAFPRLDGDGTLVVYAEEIPAG